MYSNIEHKAMEALLRGQGSAKSLKTLLKNREIRSVSIEPLISTILESFSLALSYMDSPNHLPHHEPSSQNMAGPVPRKQSKKKIYRAKGLERYRDDSPSPYLNDGFSWRKYGKKIIKTSPYERCYYRCAYAKEQNYNATKRVQKINDSPPVYRTTYVGEHGCKAPDFSVNDDTYGSKMIQFDQVVSEPVMPQLATIDHQVIAREGQGTDHMVHQDFDINDFLVDDDQFWANEFPPFSPGHFMFLDNTAAFISSFEE